MFRNPQLLQRWETFKLELDVITQQHPQVMNIQLLESPDGGSEIGALDAAYTIAGQTYVHTFPNLPDPPLSPQWGNLILAQRTDMTIDTLTNLLGNFVVEQIAEPWQEARMTAELDTISGRTYGRYLTPAANSEWRPFVTDYRAYFIFDALRQRFGKLLGQVWTKAEVVLTPDGALSLAFDYQTAFP